MLTYLLAAALLGIVQSAKYCNSCPANGVWSAWTDATNCSFSCGFCGNKLQTRQCLSFSDGCPCKGDASRLRACGGPAPCDAPQTRCCGGYSLAFDVLRGANICKAVPDSAKFSCPAGGTHEEECTPCPDGGVWSLWSSEGTCSATCGTCGSVSQTRTCKSAPSCKCSGAATRQLPCPLRPCAGPSPCCGLRKPVYSLESNRTVCGLTTPQDAAQHDNTFLGQCTYAQRN